MKFISLETDSFHRDLLKLAANAYNGDGYTVLGIACHSGSLEAVQKLIKLG
jgi:hypothetical protein